MFAVRQKFLFIEMEGALFRCASTTFQKIMRVLAQFGSVGIAKIAKKSKLEYKHSALSC